jgi:Stage II sporulation protein E (SpoIIE)
LLPPDWHRSQETAELPAGATLMLYTDGLVERRNQSLDQGIDAAAATLAERGQDHPDQVADHIMSAMTPATGYEDDVAVLIYRHPPAPLTVHVPADDPSCLALLRARLRQWLSAAGIGSREATDIMIAAGEAAANAFEHSPLADGLARSWRGHRNALRVYLVAYIAPQYTHSTKLCAGGRWPRLASGAASLGHWRVYNPTCDGQVLHSHSPPTARAG